MMLRFSFVKRMWILIIFFVSTSLKSQVISFKKLPLLFFSEQRNAFCAIQDSLIYQRTADGKWISKKIIFHSEMNSDNFNNEYFPISYRKYDYVVSKGCGEVYHLLDSTFVRLDKSFAHRNQYTGNPFFHNNKLFFFGGYGLFTSKNILTYYSTERREWFLEYTDKGQMPSPRSSCFSKLTKKHFYLLSGIYHKNNVGERVYDVWSYNFSKKKWKLLGNINPEIREVFKLSNTNTYSKSYYILYGSRLFIPYPEKNSIVEYTNDEFARVMDVVLDDKGNVLIAFRESTGKISLQRLKLDTFLGKPRKSYQLYIPDGSETNSLWFGILAVTVIIGFLVFLLVKRGKKKTINLTLSDFQICEVLKSNGTEGVELSALNMLLDDGQSNYEALKKRRELRLKELRSKLSEIYNLPPNLVILEKKSDKDKRVKLFYLNPNIKLK